MKTKHLAFFLPSLNGGGAEKNFLILCREFLRLGLHVDLVLGISEGPLRAQIPESVRVIDFNQKRISSTLLPFIRYLNRERPDIVFSTMNHTNLVAILARRFSSFSGKLIIRESNTITDVLAFDRSLKARLVPKLMRVFYPEADGVIAISNGVRERLQLVCPGLRNCTAIPNPAYFPGIEELGERPIELRRERSETVFLAVGRLVDQKNFAGLIRSFEQTQVRGLKGRLYILGEGNQRSNLEAQIFRSKVGDRIHLVPFQENPYPYFSNSDIFCLTSRWEGFGNVLIEAFAFGLPIVSTSCAGGPQEVIEAGISGLFSPVEDDEAFAANMVKAAQIEWDKKLLRARAKEYSAQVIAKKYLEFSGAIDA